MAIDINKELSFIRQIPGIGNYLGDAFERIAKGVNQLGDHVGVDPASVMPPPPTIQSLTVKTNGTGLVHAVITDNNPIQKNLHYFIEYDTNPSFPQPQVKPLGPSRTMEPLTLPGGDDNGNLQMFYFRAYSQYQGSKPGIPVHFGGTNPMAVSPGGMQQLTLIPSTGSGTAPSNGQQGGSGFGKDQTRPALTPQQRVTSAK